MYASDLPPKKIKKGWRKIIPIFIPVLILIILLTAESIISSSVELRTTSDWYNAMFGLAIININIILILILLVVIFRHLIKMITERRRKILGSRFRTKLVLTMLAVIIVPTALVYMISSDLISKGIERWYESSVEEIVRSSRRLSEVYLDDYAELVNAQSKSIAEQIRREKLLSEDKVYYLRQQVLEPLMSQIHFDIVEVYMDGQRFGETIVNPGSPVLQHYTGLGSARLERFVNHFNGPDKQPQLWREHYGNTTMIYSVSPVLSQGGEGVEPEVAGLVLLGLSLERDLHTIAREIGSYYQRYREQIDNRQVVKTASQGLLLIFTLISVFSAIWIGIYFSRGITVPIQKLAEGTRAVAGGNLDYRVESQADDELAILISSFNEMTRDLKQSKDDLEAVNKSLLETNQEVERRRRYIETLLANLSTAVISLDDEGRITTENAAAMELLDLPWSSQVGNHWRDVFKSKHLLRLREMLQSYFDEDKQYVSEQLTLRSKKGVLYLSASITSLRSEESHRMGTLIVLENLTDLARAQRTAAWQEVAQRVAHEIKNPLTPIQLSAERIRRKVLSETVRSAGPEGGNGDASASYKELISSATETIIEETGMLKSIVDAFSSFARMPRVELQPGDVNAVIDKAAAIYMSHPEESGLVIEKELEVGIPEAEIDQNQLKMAFVNIINNASEAMQGKGHLSIRSSFDQQLQMIKIEFSDEGPGVPPETKEKLFMPYFSTKTKGTGLGLAIVNRIVSEHHGTISVSDNHPGGARFIIEIPAI